MPALDVVYDDSGTRYARPVQSTTCPYALDGAAVQRATGDEFSVFQQFSQPLAEPGYSTFEFFGCFGSASDVQRGHGTFRSQEQEVGLRLSPSSLAGCDVQFQYPPAQYLAYVDETGGGTAEIGTVAYAGDDFNYQLFVNVGHVNTAGITVSVLGVAPYITAVQS